MKINEITNAQDQLELLRNIIDNTWTAIKQQADAQARQANSKKQVPKSGFKPTGLKKAPYAPPPKPLPKPAQISPPPQQIKNQQGSIQHSTKTLNKSAPMLGAPKEVPGNIISPINQNRSEKEKQELIKIARGETPWKPL